MAVAPNLETVAGFIFKEVTISSARLPIDVRIENVVSDLDIYEHIDKPYLTGSIVFNDTESIFSNIDFIGGETINIVLESTRQGSVEIRKNFYVVSIINAIKVNDNNQTIALALVEDIGYKSNLFSISKAYDDVGFRMIENIAREYLGREVIKVGDEFQEKFRVIVPYLNPIDAMCWIRNRSTNKNGLPFYLYSTLVGNSLVFKDLGTILESLVMNKTKPYSYWQSASTSDDTTTQRRTIYSYSYTKAENLFRLIDDAVVGAGYTYLNTLTGAHRSIKFDVMKDVFNPMLDNATVGNKPKSFPFDPKFNHENIPYNELSSRQITQVSSAGVFNEGNMAALSYSAERTDAAYKRRAASRAVNKFLGKAALNVVVNGYDFLDGENNTTISNKIRLEFIKSSTPKEGDNRKDPKLSGDYVIYATRHMFKRERYDIALNCVKIGNT
jgi:hypothetical protein